MNKYTETFRTWNKVASMYEEKFMNLDLYNESYDFFCKSILGTNAKILEIGCGPGNITKYLLSKRPDFDIFGIDISENMIELSRKNNPKAFFEIMDSRKIASINSKYEGIVCGFCVPYLSQSDSVKLISDSYNLLEENGILYLSFVEGDPNKSGFQTGSSGDRSYFYYHNLKHLKEQLVFKGFTNMEIIKVNYPKPDGIDDIHTIIIARKKTLHNNRFK